MKKNIWIFNHYAVTPETPGGTRHYELAKQLVEKGYNPVVFASSVPHKTRKENYLVKKEKFKIQDFEGAKFVWVKTVPYQKNDIRRVLNMLSYSVRIFLLTKKTHRLKLVKPDVVIGSSVHLLTPLSAYLIAKRFRAKFVVEIRDIWPQTLIDMEGLNEKGFIAKLLFAIENFVYKKADKIITLLPNSFQYFIDKGVDATKISWIPNGVNFSNYKNIQQYNGEQNGTFNLMFLGAYGKANALDNILDAASIVKKKGLDDIRFIFVGDGPEKNALIEYSKKLGLNNVEFRGTLPKKKIFEVLNEADAFIVSLADVAVFKYGVSSNKFFDYMAAGRPVIFTGTIDDNPVNNANAGLTVPPGDPQAVAEAIMKLFNMKPPERKQMGKNGMEYVSKNHDFSLLADKLIESIKA